MIGILCGEIWLQRCYKYGLWITVSGICEDVSSRTGQMADFPVDQHSCLYYSLKTIAVFQVPHPCDRSSLPALHGRIWNQTAFFELWCRLAHLDGLGVHSCRKQKPYSNNNETEPTYGTHPFFKTLHISFLLYIFPVGTLVTIKMPQYTGFMSTR